MRPLNDLEISTLIRLVNGEDIRNSRRPEDRAKQHLRREGYIEYSGAPHRWQLTEKGRDLAVRTAWADA